MNPRTRFLHAVQCRPVDRPPVWFMRQAGRHLPEYRELRKRVGFLDLCRTPAINAEASCQPWKRYGLDAVIVFNDILIPLQDMGLDLEFSPGPVFRRPLTGVADVARLHSPEYAAQPPAVAACLREIRRQVRDEAGLLGFVGAPFTVAGYALNGGSGAGNAAPPVLPVDSTRAKILLAMGEKIQPILVDYALAQVEAGADAIQVFESSARDVAEPTYRSLGLPVLKQLLQNLHARAPQTPIIVFGRGIGPYLDELAACGAAALSLDITQSLGETRRRLSQAGLTCALQGNLDPECFRTDPAQAAQAAGALLDEWRNIVPFPQQVSDLGPTGWVFNLAHGVPADACPEAIRAVVDAVKEYRFT